MNSLVLTVCAFVFALGILIVIHELGHYSIARLCGVKILRFSVGFGRPLATIRLGKDQTEWVLAALPLGGYVKMLDEREGVVAPNEIRRAFNRQSVGRRFAIVLAGPAANLLLAVMLYFGIYQSGIVDALPVMERAIPGTPAEISGIKRGDRIVRIDGSEVAGWQQARWKLLQRSLDRGLVELEVIDARGHLSWKQLDLSRFDPKGYEGDPLTLVGLRLIRPAPIIGRTVSGGVAERAGLTAGDRVAMVNDRPIETWEEFVREVRSSAGKGLALEVVRSDLIIRLDIVPAAVLERGTTVGKIGAEPSLATLPERTTTVRYGFQDSIKLSLQKTWETSLFSLRMMGRMLTGDVSWKNLSGPVTIADYAGQSAQAGWTSYVLFLAIISISLGVLNLLPIPLLDGGHLLYYLIEILKGSPVSEKVMEFGQRIGLVSLLFLMAFAFYNDINRLLAG